VVEVFYFFKRLFLLVDDFDNLIGSANESLRR